uniref:GBF1-like tetratricopeptide repeats domain-containing protein n=1 Tax=Meloidogyne enterolobii TaxID=390850 RepID=A0A6V7V0C0_MELEN|nr:unnamed protein product [Meloidogyne enterolobii]
MSSATSLLSPPPRATSSPISALNLNSFSDSTAESLSINFARNKKAQMATRALFELVHNYGDNLREGWKNVLDCLIYLLRANLLPPKLLELEDFVDIRGIVTIKEKFKRPQIPKKEESGLFSWLGLSVSSISSETDLNKKQINEEEQQLCNSAISLISECHPEQIITDSRYLTKSAFTELINNIIHCSFAIAPIQSKTQQVDNQDDDSIVDLTFAAAAFFPIKLTLEEEESLIFLLEFMTKILVENSDRLFQVWPSIRDYLQCLFNNFNQNQQIIERLIISLFRITCHNFCFPQKNLIKIPSQTEIDLFIDDVIQFISQKILELNPIYILMFSQQIMDGVQKLLRENGENVKNEENWNKIFSVLERINYVLFKQFSCPQNFPVEVDPITRTEEAKIRAIQFTCKVLLGNITQFYRLKSFPDLFLRLFDLMDQFLEENACSDLLAEVIQESLKNCILVCENFGVFQGPIEGLKAEVSGRLEALTVKHSNSANSKIAL